MAFSSTRTTKRPHTETDCVDIEDQAFSTNAMTTETDGSKKLPNFSQKTMETFNRILNTIATNLEHGANEDSFITDCFRQGKPNLPPKPALDELYNKIDAFRSDLSKVSSIFSDTELKNDVKSHLFDFFKEIRGNINSWYRSTEHFCRARANKTEKPPTLVSLTVTFSQAITTDEVKDRVTAILTKCAQKIESDLEIDLINELTQQTTEIRDKWANMTDNKDEKFVWAKAWRSTLRKFKGPRSFSSKKRTNDDDRTSTDHRSNDSRSEDDKPRKKSARNRRARRDQYDPSPESNVEDRPRYRRKDSNQRRYPKRNQHSTPDSDESYVPQQRRKPFVKRRYFSNSSNKSKTGGSFRRIP